MNMMTAIIAPPGRLVPPIALLRALPPGPLAKEWAHLEEARRLASLFAAFTRDDMEVAVDLLLAEMDARDGDPDADTGGAEDEPLTGFASLADDLPGCGMSDPGEHTGDERDAAWIERLDQSTAAFPRNLLRIASDPCEIAAGNPEDIEAVGDEVDTQDGEDEGLTGCRRVDPGPGCEIADAGERAEQYVTLNPDNHLVPANAA